MAFESILLDEEICISRIKTIRYFEYINNFHFSEEPHDFWEFQCVDKGEVNITVGAASHIIKKGQMIFHKPNEFHTLQVTESHCTNIAVVAFECSSQSMKFFENKILNITEQERALVAMIITEARKCIASPLDDPYLQKMEKRKDDFFGSQQLIKIYLQELLLYIIRRHITQPFTTPLSQFFNNQSSSPSYHKILRYLESHIREPVSIDDICKNNLIGRSQLQKLFQKEHQCGVIDFFSHMKIEFAKQLIRENQLNFTQISDYLGYSSIHYFSRQFKKISGMTPSSYAYSVKENINNTLIPQDAVIPEHISDNGANQ